MDLQEILDAIESYYNSTDIEPHEKIEGLKAIQDLAKTNRDDLRSVSKDEAEEDADEDEEDED